MPPPQPGVPFKGRTKDCGARKLRDEDVIIARSLAGTVTATELARRFGVTRQTMDKAIKGWNFKHLNFEYPPQR